MHTTTHRAAARALAAASLAWLAAWPGSAAAPSAAGTDGSDKGQRPSIAVRASPTFAFAPARIVIKAELKGGADDFEEYYCAGVEWDWDDGTVSEVSQDCEPYEAGKSEIKRRYTVEHVYRLAGRYRVQFKLKRNDKVIVAANTTVEVRPGVRPFGEYE